MFFSQRILCENTYFLEFLNLYAEPNTYSQPVFTNFPLVRG